MNKNPKSQIPNPKFQIPNPKFQIPNSKFQIPNPKSQIPNPKSQIPNFRKGFTFIEVIVAVFIFAVIMTAATAVFASAFKSYRAGKVIQKDLEAAQQAMNIIAKTLRTSKVVSPAGQATSTTIRVYDYSQADGTGSNKECITYEFTGSGDNNRLQISAANVADETACTGAGSVVVGDIITGMTTGDFTVNPPTATYAGKITIAMQVCPAPDGCAGDPKDEAKIQTTVSLRNW